MFRNFEMDDLLFVRKIILYHNPAIETKNLQQKYAH